MTDRFKFRLCVMSCVLPHSRFLHEYEHGLVAHVGSRKGFHLRHVWCVDIAWLDIAKILADGRHREGWCSSVGRHGETHWHARSDRAPNRGLSIIQFVPSHFHGAAAAHGG